MTLRKTPLCLASCLVASLWAGAVSPGKENTAHRDMVLADFEKSDVAAGWKTVNDNVMGGRSKGGPSFADGLLIFTGETNTNGGGFSSIRTQPGKYDLSGKSGLLIRVRGDGRTYKASLRTDVKMRSWAVPFRADFQTKKGKWQEIYLPLESFTPSLHGRSLSEPPALDPSKVQALGFMIYDKKDGPFSLEIDWVKAVNRDGSELVKTESSTIVDQVLADERFSTLKTALTEAELVGVLQGKGPFTVFAPTDAAFKALPKGTVEELLKSENREKLTAILSYHAVAGEVSAGDALNAKKAKTLSGMPVEFGIKDGLLKVNGATIRTTDIECDNGVIHVIDAVLLPPSKTTPIRQGDCSSTEAMRPTKRIEAAIERGVPIFNGGEPGKCAAIYRECLADLSQEDSIDAKLRNVVKMLLKRAEKAPSDVDRAWLYRAGLDRLHSAISQS